MVGIVSPHQKRQFYWSSSMAVFCDLKGVWWWGWGGANLQYACFSWLAHVLLHGRGILFSRSWSKMEKQSTKKSPEKTRFGYKYTYFWFSVNSMIRERKWKREKKRSQNCTEAAPTQSAQLSCVEQSWTLGANVQCLKQTTFRAGLNFCV